jgi:formate/nitrite transporter
MAYVKPEAVVEQMIQAGAYKAGLSAKHLLIRGFLAGSLLGYAVTVAFSAIAQTDMRIVGSLVFPLGFVMIVLLGLELVTGNFALIPLAVLEKKTTLGRMLYNWWWVYVGHLAGTFFYGFLFYISATKMGNVADPKVGTMIARVAEANTLGYAQLGLIDGWATAFVKAILCNWMVTLGAVMAMVSQHVIGKIMAMWLPILTFFALGFEHAVVNMFLMPTGMLFGANITLFDWWFWNQIPVTIGNLVAGFTLTGMGLYLTHRKKEEIVPSQVVEEAA